MAQCLPQWVIRFQTFPTCYQIHTNTFSLPSNTLKSPHIWNRSYTWYCHGLLKPYFSGWQKIVIETFCSQHLFKRTQVWTTEGPPSLLSSHFSMTSTLCYLNLHFQISDCVCTLRLFISLSFAISICMYPYVCISTLQRAFEALAKASTSNLSRLQYLNVVGYLEPKTHVHLKQERQQACEVLSPDAWLARDRVRTVAGKNSLRLNTSQSRQRREGEENPCKSC